MELWLEFAHKKRFKKAFVLIGVETEQKYFHIYTLATNFSLGIMGKESTVFSFQELCNGC